MRTDLPVEAPEAFTCLVVLPDVVDLPKFLPEVEVCLVVLPELVVVVLDLETCFPALLYVLEVEVEVAASAGCPSKQVSTTLQKISVILVMANFLL